MRFLLFFILQLTGFSLFAQLPGFAWAKNLSGANNEYGYDINYDKCGNIYVCGYFTDSVDFNPSNPGTNILNSPIKDHLFLAKYNASGQYQWAFSVGSVSVTSYAFEIEVDNSGNVYLAGTFDDAGSGKPSDFDPGPGTATLLPSGFDGFLAKYNTNGQYQWAFNFGSFASESAYRLELDAAGDIVVTGNFGGATDFDPSPATYTINCVSGNQDIYVAKYTSGGAFINATSAYGGPGWSVDAYGLTVDNTNNIYVTGTYNGPKLTCGTFTIGSTNPSANDGYVLKFNSGLTVSNGFNFGCPVFSSITDRGNDLTIDNSTGDMILLGYLSGTADLDPGPGTYTLAGSSTTGLNFLAKYNSSLQLQWAFNNDAFYGKIKTEPSGNFYVAGVLRGTADLDPSATVVNYTATSLQDLLVANFSSNGSFQWAFNLGSGGYNEIIGMDHNQNIGLAITGYFEQAADFDPGVGVATLNHVGNDDIFIANYTVSPIPSISASSSASLICAGQTATLTANGAPTYSWSTGFTTPSVTVSPLSTTMYTVTGTYTTGCLLSTTVFQTVSACTGINELNPYDATVIYPNPTYAELTLKMNQKKDLLIEIYNAIGEIILTQTITEPETKINLEKETNGLYFIKIIKQGATIDFLKFVKE